MATPTCPGSDSVLNASGIGTFNLSAMVETPALPSLTVCDLTSGIPNRVAYDVDLPGPGALGPLSGSYTYTLQATPGEFFMMPEWIQT
jgi:hypothetical protein